MSDPLPAELPKGTFGGRCNRTACQRPGATWFNRGMAASWHPSAHKALADAYYCPGCAKQINRYNVPGETAMCVGPEDPEHPWFSKRWVCVCCGEIQEVLPGGLPGREGSPCACLRGACDQDVLGHLIGRPVVGPHGGRWLCERYDADSLLRYGLTAVQAEALFSESHERRAVSGELDQGVSS